MAEILNSRKILDDKSLADTALKMSLLAGAGSEISDIALAGVLNLDAANNQKTVKITSDRRLDEILVETGRFPAYFTDMISVGMETGKLQECLQSLHDYYLRSHQIKKSVRQALYQPLSMLAISLLVVLVILVKIFPVFSIAYASAGMAVSPAMSVLLSISDYISSHLILCVGNAVFAIIGVCALSILPPVRKFVIRMAGRTGSGRAVRNAKLVQALSMGLDSGMDINIAMAMALDVSGFDEPDAILNALRSEYVGDILQKRHVVSVSDGQILATGEKAGNMPDAAAYVASSMMEAADSKIRKLSARIEPVITLIGAAMAGGIIIMSMLPLLDAMSSIG